VTPLPLLALEKIGTSDSGAATFNEISLMSPVKSALAGDKDNHQFIPLPLAPPGSSAVKWNEE